MTKKLYLVRHGESEMNIGKPCKNHTTVPLTNKGLEQAQEFGNTDVEVDMVVYSPYLRTQQTALPYVNNHNCFIKVPQMWDCVHELIMLSPSLSEYIPHEESHKLTREFYSNSYYNPYYTDRDMDDSECLVDLKDRALDMFDKVLDMFDEVNSIMIFTHGQFMIMADMIFNAVENLDDIKNIDFNLDFYRQFHNHKEVKNCEMIEYDIEW